MEGVSEAYPRSLKGKAGNFLPLTRRVDKKSLGPAFCSQGVPQSMRGEAPPPGNWTESESGVREGWAETEPNFKVSQYTSRQGLFSSIAVHSRICR